MPSQTIFPKRTRRNRTIQSLNRLPEDDGDPTITGIAIILGIAELIVSFLFLIFSQNYYFFAQLGLQLFFMALESYSLFVGFLVVAYAGAFEIIILLVFCGFETFKPERSLIPTAFPGITETGRLWIIIAGYALVFWCGLRLIWTRRAMHYIYMARYEKRRNDALIAQMTAEGFVQV
ncbi:uncharacterized protein CELE_K07A1.13 [Caenorhabditis elegans]|uniref:Transmembrane protein n=1 Tax=Caenorhabditis elegans TaxID=6239 RepID=Q9XVL4_CAEEL|nr:Transmembrane protein [Caenorhabditis elegans]CAB03173.1 Transmembrane protein [Caenorhabditis elegans]|eukprot:NP_492541.1 Uncharacterized protein CELE_K07A1.13 [Caenorhabditis elegans]